MIKLYYHLAMMNNWREITDFFFESVISSGLYDKCDSIDVVFVGSNGKPDFKFSGLGKINLIDGGELREFEFPTLQKLWEESLHNESSIFYFHSKGASFDRARWQDEKDIIKTQYAFRNYQSYRDVESAYAQTRRWLRRCLIDRFEDCLSCLDSCDVFCLKHKPNLRFFPSNFWWSKSSYVKSLGRPTIRKDRYDAEMWLFRDGVNVKSAIGRGDEYDLLML